MSTRTDYRDAIGWLYANARQDFEARDQLALMVDPCGLVDALTDMLLGLANISTDGDVMLYIDTMRDQLEDMLDRSGMEDT